MIVVCEKCGTKHKINTDISKMSGKMAKAECSSCNHKMLFSISDQSHQTSDDGNIMKDPKASPSLGKIGPAAPNPDTNAQIGDKKEAKGRLGIRSKMLLLFFIIPVVLFGSSSAISLGDLNAEIDINSKDELGDLADAIARMQSSVRISLALTVGDEAALNPR